MASSIIETRGIGEVIRMLVINEVAYFFVFFLVVLGLVFIVDFGFDIEESIASVATALSAMTLCFQLEMGGVLWSAGEKSYSLHVVFIVFILLLLLLFIVIVFRLGTVVLFLFLLVIVIIIYVFRARRRRVFLFVVIVVLDGALATLFLAARLIAIRLLVRHVSGSRVKVLLVGRVIESRVVGCHDEINGRWRIPQKISMPETMCRGGD